MKIGMSGTGGVGKTTVVNAILEEYPNLQVPVSSAREIFKHWGITEASQREMSPEQLLDLQEAITGHWWTQQYKLGDNSIWDRTMLDHFAYGIVRNHKSVDKRWLDHKKDQTKRNLKSYSHFFFFPKPRSWEPKADGVRDPSPGTREMVHLVMAGFLADEMPGMMIHYVPTDVSQEKVVNFVLDRLMM
jgi:hypothetical protein